MKSVLESTIRWILAAAMVVLFFALARRNRRVGYQKPPRQALLAEVVTLVTELEDALYSEEKRELPPEATVVAETPIDQLVSLSLAVQSGESVSASNDALEIHSSDVAPEIPETCSEGVMADR